MSFKVSGLAQFRKNLREVSKKKFPNAVKRFQGDLAARHYSGIVLKTPVLTGHARHNWVVTVEEPWTQEVEGVFGGDTTGDAFTGYEIQKMEFARRTLMKADLGETIYISNNAPYITRLEDGYSGKAPAGMVEVTINEVLEVVKTQRELKDDDSGT